MKIGVAKKLLPDLFPGTAFKQYVIWHHDCSLPRSFENGADMLDKIELFV